MLLHVGMLKTGTTSFQVQCQEHARQLLKGGLLYPQSVQTSSYPNHTLLATDLLRPRRGRSRSRLLHDILNEVEGAGCDRVLVSGELLSLLWQRPDLLGGLRSSFERLGY